MLPDHVLMDKAIDAAHKAKPAADLDQLAADAKAKVAAFKKLVEPPSPPAETKP